MQYERKVFQPIKK
jgi:hypothetical protein